MNLSLGGGKRSFATIAASIALTLTAASCSGSDGSSDGPEPLPAGSTTPDQAAQDEAAVVDLANRYWAAVVQSENTGLDDASQFDAVATPDVAEGLLAQVAEYETLDLLRVGQPAITEVEAAVTGENAQILLCLDEDEWTAEVGGQPIEGDEKFGNAPWGARAEKIDGRWLVAEITPAADSGKACA